jgi:hypothetical protein
VNLSPKKPWLPAALMMLVPLSAINGDANSHAFRRSINGFAIDGTIAGVGIINGEAHAFTWTLNQ